MNNILGFSGIITRQQAELAEQLAAIRLVDRDLGTERVRRVFNTGPGVVVIQGVRRCGKSIYSTSCFDGDFVYVNFDDERLSGLRAADLESILEACYGVKGKALRNFIFDEIQVVEGWEPFVSRLGRSKNVVVTGSNAKLLSSELATHLTGRYLPLTLYPFSFSEFLRARGMLQVRNLAELMTAEAAEVRRLFAEYQSVGGFPDVQKYGSVYPQQVYADIVQKDILVRHRIKNPTVFKEFAKLIVSNYGQEVSLTKAGKVVGIESPNTASKYAQLLQETFLAFAVNRYVHKLKGQLVSNKKYYAIDAGVIRSIGYTPSPNWGALLENLVFLELLRQRDYHQRFEEIFFWQTGEASVDFLLRSNKRADLAIQVCADLSNPLTRERETRALIKVADDINPRRLIILADNPREQIVVEGKTIEVLPLISWLCNPQELISVG